MKRFISMILTLTLIISMASVSFTMTEASSLPYVKKAKMKLLTSNIIGQTFIKPNGKTCKLTDLVDKKMTKPMFTTNYPYVFEGACSDGEDYYFTVVYQVPTTTDKTPADYRENGYVIKYDVSADKWYISNALPIGHSNDICYNADRNLIVSCNYAPAEDSVDLINMDLTYNSRVKVKDESGNSLKISQISYDASNNRYLVTSRYKVSGKYYHYVLNTKFKATRSFKRLAKPKDELGNEYGTQGTDCTSKYVFVLYSDLVDKTNNIIYVMDWKGNKIRTITVPVAQEIEDMFSIKDVFYMNFHLKSKGGYFYNAYLINYKIKYDANGGSGKMSTSSRYYGLSQKIASNKFEKKAARFVGWTANRGSDNKWHYVSSDGAKKGWYVEGSEPNGYEKYIYPNKKTTGTLSKVNGDVITMYAQWENYTYTFKFDANGGTGEMADQKITYGVSGQKISANKFTRTSYKFKGWTCYRHSDEKWYCVNKSDDTDKGWYTESEIPAGFKKYVFKNKQSVSKQSAVDGDVLTMYAKWKKTT